MKIYLLTVTYIHLIAREKKYSIFLIFLLCASPKIFAQSYHIFPENRIISYQRIDSVDFFIDTDSLKIDGTDTVLYFNRGVDTINNFFTSCDYYALDTSIMGNKYVRLNDSVEVLFNKNGDSIFFKPQASIGDEWTFYKFPNGSFIKATYSYPIYGTIFDVVVDSLKRIVLTVFDSLYNQIEDSPFWNERFDMTKNYGLSRFFNINEFPNDTLAIRLLGATNPDSGIVDLTSYYAFNFNLGDEFHFTDTLFSNGPPYHNEITLYKYFILTKSGFADSVNYTALRAQVQYIDDGASGLDTVRIYDTVSLHYKYSDYAFLDTIELTLLQKNKYGFSDFVLDSTYENIAHKYVYDWFDYDAASGCLNNPDNIYLPEQLYGNGLGLMHYKDSSSTTYHVLDMIYFHKGLKEWGTPLNFDSLGLALSNFSDNIKINIYPNPASTIININLPVNNVEQTQIEIFNIQGELVKSENFNTQKLTMDISFLQAGYYILKLINQDDIYFTKFIKQ